MAKVQGKEGWQHYPGTESFVSLLQSLQSQEQTDAELAVARSIFKWSDPVYVGRAPGRMDVMGGIADYSGALVLQMPIAEACFAAVQVDKHPQGVPEIRVVSPGHGGHRGAVFSTPSASLFPNGQPLSYEDAVAFFKASPDTSWAAYPVGCLLVLARERGVTSLGSYSYSILITSQVPEGKGVSSSASVEVCTMSALVAALGVELGGWDLAALCQVVENRVVGAPCGIMDQMACTLGEEGRLLALLCQPATVEGTVAIPPHLQVWGVDSGVRHSVGGSDYTSVRIGAFMGLAAVRDALSTETEKSDLPYLVTLAPSQWESDLSHKVPVSLTGGAFLETYGSHVDSVTKVDPNTEYAVRIPVGHPIREDYRVRLFRQLLSVSPATPEQCRLLGELMFQSHASYSACQLGSPGTDRLVQLVREHQQDAAKQGKKPLLYGAKITGGGCGGTVCILGAAGAAADAVVRGIAERYWTECGFTGSAKVFSGSSGGAASFGCLTVTF